MDFLVYVIGAMFVFSLVFLAGRTNKPATNKSMKKCCGNSCGCHKKYVS